MHLTNYHNNGMKMTYSELLIKLLQLNAEQLRSEVTITDVGNDKQHKLHDFIYEDYDPPLLTF